MQIENTQQDGTLNFNHIKMVLNIDGLNPSIKDTKKQNKAM